MNLYCVRVTFEMVVAANDIDDAMEVAAENAEEELANQNTAICYPRVLTSEDQIPGGWSSSLPYGADTEGRTVAEILKNGG